MAARSTTVLRQFIRTAAGGDFAALCDRDLLRCFADSGDQAAFATLFRRHSGMVLGVCRRTLPCEQDVEDACQATFLLLSRKAKSGRWQASVASWLYVAARRVAHNACVAAARRSRREKSAAVPEAVQPVDRMTVRELLTALDEELDKLPPRYREPLVLCYLEGLTRDEAAARLGVPAATLKSQLDRGRKRLNGALTRRGYALGAGFLALVATSPARASSLRLVQRVLASAGGSPPASVAKLAEGVAMNGFGKIKLLGLLALVGAVVLSFRPGSGELIASGQTPEKAAAPLAPKVAAARANEIAVTGRVLDPDGKPLAGAMLLVAGKEDKPVHVGVSGNDGRFAVSVPRGGRPQPVLIAQADGFGIDFATVSQVIDRTGPQEIELRLVKDRPLRGRVLDTQGRPVAGVTVGIQGLTEFADASPDRAKRWTSPATMTARKMIALWSGSIPRATTDAEGCFTLHGVGADRAVILRFNGAGIAEFDYQVVNREGFNPKPFNDAMRQEMKAIDKRLAARILFHAPDGDFVAEPEMPIRGVVTAADTGKGRPGAVVRLTRLGEGDNILQFPLTATTDAAGRYEIRGARKGKSYTLRVESDPESGYTGAAVEVNDTPAYVPILVNFRVFKGVIVTGKIVDTSTGKGVPGSVKVDVLYKNPFLSDYPRFDDGTTQDMVRTSDDGSFKAVTIPGPVILLGGPDPWRLADGAEAPYHYRLVASDPKYPQYFPELDRGQVPKYLNHRGVELFPFNSTIWCKVLEIKAGSASVEQDILLEPATRLPVHVRDADGKPLTGVRVTGALPRVPYFLVTCKTDVCNVYDLEPGKQRLLVFFAPGRSLAGALSLKGDEKGPQTVSLRPTGSVKGRLVGADGKPLVGVMVALKYKDFYEETFLQKSRLVLTANDGSFTVNTVFPELPFDVQFHWFVKSVTTAPKLKGLTVDPGQTKDLGDLAGKIVDLIAD
jgi:RNA polymerase sigma factor (sigma-70 family)